MLTLVECRDGKVGLQLMALLTRGALYNEKVKEIYTDFHTLVPHKNFKEESR